MADLHWILICLRSIRWYQNRLPEYTTVIAQFVFIAISIRRTGALFRKFSWRNWFCPAGVVEVFAWVSKQLNSTGVYSSISIIFMWQPSSRAIRRVQGEQSTILRLTLGLLPNMWKLRAIRRSLTFVFWYSFSEVEIKSTPVYHIPSSHRGNEQFLSPFDRRFGKGSVHYLIKGFFLVLLFAVQNSLVLRDGSLEVFGKIKRVRIQSIGVVDELSVDVHLIYRKIWMWNTFIMSIQWNWRVFLHLRGCRIFCFIIVLFFSLLGNVSFVTMAF